MKLFFVFAILFLNHLLVSQDTIFTKSQDILLVRVLEISNTEVAYKFYFNPDGVIHKLANSQIVKIVYQNGKVESRFQLSKKTEGNPLSKFKSGMFIVEERHISIDNRDITHKEAFKIMLKRDPQVNSDELNSTLLNAEGKKNGQIGFVIAGPVFLVGGLYLGRRNYYGPADKQKFQTFALTGLGLFVTSEITAMIYKALKNKQIRKAALLYNKEVFF